MSSRGRVWAWVAFVVLSIYAPVVAGLTRHDDWLLSVTVATMVGVVIIADDRERRRVAAKSDALG